jgi:hypothetical protein
MLKFDRLIATCLVLFLILPKLMFGQANPTIHIDSILYFDNYSAIPSISYSKDSLISNKSIKTAIVYFHSNNIDSSAEYFYQTDQIVQWSPIGNQKWFVFHNLPSGNNTLLIVAKTPKKVKIAQHQINIFTPMALWKNWWFPVVFAAFSIAFAFFLAMIFYGQKIRQEKRMNEMRQHIAFDLHDEIGATLGSIALLGDWAIKKIDKSDPNLAHVINPNLKNMVAQTRAILDDLRIVIWAVNPKYAEISHLLTKIHAFNTELLSPAEIEFELNCDDKIKSTSLSPLENQQILSFIRECFHNIVKHSKASLVITNLKYEQDHFLVQIIDNGIGFDTKGDFSGFGLQSLQKRADKIGATLEIRSKSNQGTNIRLLLKK